MPRDLRDPQRTESRQPRRHHQRRDQCLPRPLPASAATSPSTASGSFADRSIPGPRYDMTANSLWLYTRPDMAKLHMRVLTGTAARWASTRGSSPPRHRRTCTPISTRPGRSASKTACAVCRCAALHARATDGGRHARADEPRHPRPGVASHTLSASSWATMSSATSSNWRGLGVGSGGRILRSRHVHAGADASGLEEHRGVVSAHHRLAAATRSVPGQERRR